MYRYSLKNALTIKQSSTNKAANLHKIEAARNTNFKKDIILFTRALRMINHLTNLAFLDIANIKSVHKAFIFNLVYNSLQNI